MALSLRILGKYAIHDEIGGTRTLPTRKTWALLAYLAVNADRPQSREHLITLLWGDRGDRQARQSLSHALRAIRKLEPASDLPLLENDGAYVTLRGDAMTIDVVQFRALFADRVIDAAEIYQGPLLEGLSIPDRAFQDWLTATRVEFHDLACEALERAAELAVAAGDLPSAIDWAKRLVRLDSLRESGHQLLIRLLYECGDRARALRQYKDCADRLRTELGVEPGPATKALYMALRQSEAVGGLAGSHTNSSHGEPVREPVPLRLVVFGVLAGIALLAGAGTLAWQVGYRTVEKIAKNQAAEITRRTDEIARRMTTEITREIAAESERKRANEAALKKAVEVARLRAEESGRKYVEKFVRENSEEIARNQAAAFAKQSQILMKNQAADIVRQAGEIARRKAEEIVQRKKLGIVILHGRLGFPNGNIFRLASSLAATGAIVETPEMPWSPRENYRIPYDEAMKIIDESVQSLRRKGARRIILTGHSMGANGAVGYAARYDGISALVLLSPSHNIDRHGFHLKLRGNDYNKARRMVVSGEGNSYAVFNEVIQDRIGRVRTTAKNYLSYFDPDGPASYSRNGNNLKPGIAVLNIVGDKESFYTIVNGPTNDKSDFFTVPGTHESTPWKSIEVISLWLRSLDCAERYCGNPKPVFKVNGPDDWGRLGCSLEDIIAEQCH